ncbi:hypothetical protein JCM11491_004510, partial [Sporobolomyces phaffii]
KLVKHVLARSSEASARPALVSQLRQVLESTTAFHASAIANDTAAAAADVPARFTPDELASVTKLVADATAWLDDAVKKQDRLKGHEDPVLKVVDLEKKIKDLEAEVRKLAKKKAPRAKKAKPTASSKKSKDQDEPATEHKKDEL